MLSRFAGEFSSGWIPACAGMTEYFGSPQVENIWTVFWIAFN
jgi:hypothetical protein